MDIWLIQAFVDNLVDMYHGKYKLHLSSETCILNSEWSLNWVCRIFSTVGSSGLKWVNLVALISEGLILISKPSGTSFQYFLCNNKNLISVIKNKSHIFLTLIFLEHFFKHFTHHLNQNPPYLPLPSQTHANNLQLSQAWEPHYRIVAYCDIST